MAYTRCPGWGQESCGAEIVPGHPCNDAYCPQRRVTAEQYQALERERDALRSEVERGKRVALARQGD